MPVGVPWPALATLAVGVATVALLYPLYRRKDAPGARYFLVVVGVMAWGTLAYGVGLLVFDPAPRYALEVATWLSVVWIAPAFLAFALAYTGRGHLIRAAWFRAFVIVSVLSTLLFATNHVHGFVWTDFRLDPVFGAATVQYAFGPWAYAQFVLTMLMATIGVLLLFDTVAGYGPLYRAQAVALALTPLPPAVAFTLWLFEVGPVPQLNATPMMFLPHLLLDFYALYGGEAFEFSPATRRTAERAAIDDLPSPVAIVDTEGRVVTLNPAAEDAFAVERRDALAEPLDTVVAGDDIDVTQPSQSVAVVRGGERREYTVRSTPLSTDGGEQVGYTVSISDVTDARQREQRIQVINRLLRHNLRNDLTVVSGFAEAIPELLAEGDSDERPHDAAIADAADTIVAESRDLMAIGEKAREADRVIERADDRRDLALQAVLEPLVEDARADHPDATIGLAVPPALKLHTSPAVLSVVFENLIENALVHHDGAAPSVSVALEGVDAATGSALVTVADDGPGIPTHEYRVIETGEESALEHGSGLGLWLVKWGVTSLGGDVEFAVDGEGSRVTLRLPGVIEGDDGAGIVGDMGEDSVGDRAEDSANGEAGERTDAATGSSQQSESGVSPDTG